MHKTAPKTESAKMILEPQCIDKMQKERLANMLS